MKRARRDTIVTLADRSAAHNFYVGAPLRLVHSNEGLRGATRWENALYVLRATWRSATRWWRPRTVVSAIDAGYGVITAREQRWSWTKWRWL